MSAQLRLPAGMAALPRLVEWVDAQAAGLDRQQAYALRLCVEELAGNVLLHGAASTLQLALDGTRLLVEDDGPAFDPSAAPEPARPASLDDAAVGGLGLLLTRRFSSGLAYAREAGWNRVTVTL